MLHKVSATYRGAKELTASLNLPAGSRNQPTGTGGSRWEIDMTIFSFVFTALFLAFIVAAIIGHALLIEALLRPFFGRVALARPVPATNSLLTAR
jgi:hypothetical protein